MPQTKKRYTLEGVGLLEPKISVLEDYFEEEEEEKNEDEQLPDGVDSGDHDMDY